MGFISTFKIHEMRSNVVEEPMPAAASHDAGLSYRRYEHRKML